MEEVWKEIDGYEGLYAISNLGNIKCLEHKCPGRYKNSMRTVKEHDMKSVLNKKNGYYYVTLSKFDRGKTFAVHKLVAKTFVDNPFDYVIVNHKDENKQNNCADNLEWCTSLYNNTYNNVHKKRKHYVHQRDYDTDLLIKKSDELNAAIKEYIKKYPDVTDEMIQELLSQRQNGN